MSAGGFTCGIKSDDTLACWGENYGFGIDPPAGGFVDVSVGRCQACAVASGGQVDCWGCPLGDGGFEPPVGSFVAVAMGPSHLCAIRSGDRALVCTGSLELVDNSAKFEMVASAADSSCAVVRDEAGSNVRCWGSNADGRATPPAIHATALGAGGHGFCALTPEGEASCWGLDNAGQTDAAEGPFTAVDDTCGLRDNGEIVCWSSGPITNEPAGCFRSLSAGYSHGCAIRHDDRAVCWGNATGGATTPP